MKTVMVTEEFVKAAKNLASYVDNDDSEYDTLKQMLRDGVPATASILYDAAVVGDWTDSFDEWVEKNDTEE